MSDAIDAARADWPALRRRFAGESLARVLAFCGWQAETGERAGGELGAEVILLRTGDKSRHFRVGPVELLWRGAPLAGSTPDWPRRAAPGAVRFFLTARPLAEPVVLDCDLAARLDSGNPFYFTCYTHKRLRALLSRPEPEGLFGLAPFTGEGRALALAIDHFPASVRRAAETADPWPVNRYALDLAAAVRDFLHTGALALNRPLLAAAETALGNALGLLGLRGRRHSP